MHYKVQVAPLLTPIGFSWTGSAWILQVVSEPRSRVRLSQGAIPEGGIVGAEMLSPRVMAEGRSRMPKALKVAAG